MTLREIIGRAGKPRDGLVFLYLLSLADENGEVRESLYSISDDLEVQRMTLWRIVNRLEKRNMLRNTKRNTLRNTTNSNSVITICDYDSYKGGVTYHQASHVTYHQAEQKKAPLSPLISPLESTPQTPLKDKPPFKPPISPKENISKKEEEHNELKFVCKKNEKGTDFIAAKAATNKRKEKFYQELIPYVGKYPKEIIREFFDYWSELNRSETKMRFELMKTWQLNLRLATWAKNSKMNYQTDRSVVHGGNRDEKAREERAAEAAALVARLIATNKPVI